MPERDIRSYRTLARVRILQIAEEDQAMRRWLRFVRVFGWPLFIVGIVCPVLAGSLGAADLAGGKHGLAVVILSFAGAVALALHKGLGCDSYQESQRRTMQSLRSLGEAYEAVCVLPDAAVVSAIEAAEHRLRELREKSTDLPQGRRRSFQSNLQDAEAEISRPAPRGDRDERQK